MARGVSHVLPVFITAAGGGVLVDADGNSLIDFGSGIAVTSVGNSAPRLAERVRHQAGQFTHTCFMVTPYEGYVAVCEKLAEHTPGSHDKRSALFNSGAEAVENAVKIARHATGRQAVVAFDHAYHGRTNLTMALTAKNMPYKDKFGPFAGEIYRVPMAYPLRWPGGPDRCAKDALDVITGLIDTQVGEDNVAAVIIEPIQGEGGFVVPPPGFLPGLARALRAARHPGDRRRDPERLLPDRRLVRLRPRGRRARPRHHGERHSPAGCRWPRVTGRAEIMDWRARRAASAGPTGATRSRAPPRSARSRRWRPRTWPGPAGSARSCCPGCASWPAPTRSSPTSAAVAP